MPVILQIILLFFAALIAGALNSVAGGGSFISFPMLVATGVPEINANMTNTIALWPGSAASVSAYRNELNAQRRVLLPLMTISLIGGLFGALLLINTDKTTFNALLPFLMLFATAT
ncbi:MAG TPA: TSUP family transporter, partial [Aggregatilineales bacterium]|nr:TSUP family transporter [Aggregatilineales bacterium]